MDIPGRKPLWHEVPSWVDPDEGEYFITICCGQRGTNQLCLPNVSDVMLSSARFYYEQRKWFLTPFILMPDHVHMLASFARGQRLEKIHRREGRRAVAAAFLRAPAALTRKRAGKVQLHSRQSSAARFGQGSVRVAIRIAVGMMHRSNGRRNIWISSERRPYLDDDRLRRGPALRQAARRRFSHAFARFAALAISAKSRGSRLAPPTSAPSISGCDRSSVALEGFTLPPY